MTERTRGPSFPQKYSPNNEQASNREKPERRAGQEGGRREKNREKGEGRKIGEKKRKGGGQKARERGKREEKGERKVAARTWRPRLERSGVRSSGERLRIARAFSPEAGVGGGEGGGTARLAGEPAGQEAEAAGPTTSSPSRLWTRWRGRGHCRWRSPRPQADLRGRGGPRCQRSGRGPGQKGRVGQAEGEDHLHQGRGVEGGPVSP